LRGTRRGTARSAPSRPAADRACSWRSSPAHRTARTRVVPPTVYRPGPCRPARSALCSKRAAMRPGCACVPHAPPHAPNGGGGASLSKNTTETQSVGVSIASTRRTCEVSHTARYPTSYPTRHSIPHTVPHGTVSVATWYPTWGVPPAHAQPAANRSAQRASEWAGQHVPAVPRRTGYHAAWDTTPRWIPRRVGYHAARGTDSFASSR
jgi:hypothetical protein